MTPHHLIVIPAQAGIQFCTGCTYALEHRDVREGRVQDVLHEMCSRHFISAYVPVGDALDDDREVGPRREQWPSRAQGCARAASIAFGNDTDHWIPSQAGYDERGGQDTLTPSF